MARGAVDRALRLRLFVAASEERRAATCWALIPSSALARGRMVTTVRWEAGDGDPDPGWPRGAVYGGVHGEVERSPPRAIGGHEPAGSHRGGPCRSGDPTRPR